MKKTSIIFSTLAIMFASAAPLTAAELMRDLTPAIPVLEAPLTSSPP